MKLSKKLLICFVFLTISTNGFAMNERNEIRRTKSSKVFPFFVTLAVMGVSTYALSKYLPHALEQPNISNISLTSAAAVGMYNSVPATYSLGKGIIGLDSRWIDGKIKPIGYIAGGLGKIGAGVIVGNPIQAFHNISHGNFDSFTLKNNARLIAGTGLVMSGIKDLNKAYNSFD